MIERATFSALPHEIIRDVRVSRDARLLYAVLQMYWWQGGECWEAHATLASDLGCGVRQLQRYLDELITARLIVERRRGNGQQKAYGPVSTRQESRVQHDTDVVLMPNATPVTGQHDTPVVFNTTPVSDRGRHPEDRELVPVLPGGVVAANAAPPAPTVAKAAPKKSRRSIRTASAENETPAPETIELTEQSYATAARWGFTREDVDFERERFLERSRRDGWTYTDWKAGFRTWLLNEVRYAKRDGRPVGLAASGNPPSGRASPPRPDDHLTSTVHRTESARF